MRQRRKQVNTMYDEYLGESHGILRNTVRRFVEREIAPFVDRWEREKGFPRELYQKAGEAGFFGIGSPEAYGGTPCDIFHEIVVVEEMIRCGSVGLVSGLFCSGIAMPPIVAMGSEDQKERFLPPIIRGETIAVLGVTEPSGGSDVANLRTRAVRDGDHYIVNGSKTFITSGVRADLVTAAVRTGGEGAGGISLLLIERGTPGFTVSKNIEKMGWHASDTAELSFIDCQVPRENLLGTKTADSWESLSIFKRSGCIWRYRPKPWLKWPWSSPSSTPGNARLLGKPSWGFR